MKKYSLLLLSLMTILVLPSFAQKTKKYTIPDIPGYLTLKGDFHMHTVFSDGLVWPTVRVGEAVNEGIDIIAVTDHIEYRPHLNDIPSDLNRSYDIEKPVAEKNNILLVKGAEITRSMPPGHFNALFIRDADSLAIEDFKAVVQEAKKQGGFIMWNHPGWKAQQPDTIQWFDIHTWMLDNGLMNGIEIYNDREYYRPVFDWALKEKPDHLRQFRLPCANGDSIRSCQFTQTGNPCICQRTYTRIGKRSPSCRTNCRIH